MSNILNWHDYNVIKVAELEHDYQVHAEIAEPPSHCPRRTFSSVAEDVGVDEKTVRNIFNDYC